MFSHILSKHVFPKRISTDHDPLFNYLRWVANLRILAIDEIKTVAYVPKSHPFVERLIGTIRREFLDKILFLGKKDLLTKLNSFKEYYNKARIHSGIDYLTPEEKWYNKQPVIIDFKETEWKSYCYGLYKLPRAA